MNKKIDWNKLWRTELLNTSWRKNRGGLVEVWDKRAHSYSRMIESRTEQTNQIINRLEIRVEDSIIDIGAGPGTLSLPLSEISAEVTVVDPSAMMLKYLREGAEAKGCNNINYVNKTWEDTKLGVDIYGGDVVIACHCLIMPEMREALEKMNDAAGRMVYLFRFAGNTGWDFEKIWPKLYDEEFNPNPDYIYIVNILHQMGIYADVEILEQHITRTYSSYDEAVDDLLESFVEPPGNARSVVYDYMKTKLIPANDVLCSEQDIKVAMISWHK